MLEQLLEKFLKVLKQLIKTFRKVWKQVAEKSRVLFGKIGKWIGSKLQVDGEPWSLSDIGATILRTMKTFFKYPFRFSVLGSFIWNRDSNRIRLKPV